MLPVVLIVSLFTTQAVRWSTPTFLESDVFEEGVLGSDVRSSLSSRIKTSPGKTIAIVGWPLPMNKTELKSFWVSTRMTYEFSSQSGGCNVTLPGPSLQTLCSAANYVVFMTALDEVIRNNPTISGSCERVKPIDDPLDKYDFIVVGGGTGGAATAGRLAEVCNWKVLVLEAGPDESAAAQIPAFAAKLIGAEIDWNYYSTNESFGCLARGGSCYLTAAKCLGGNSAHNDMIYMRGNPKDYDNWAAMGNDGWGWDDVFHYFLKQENNANIDRVGLKYYSTGGPLCVGRSPYISELSESFLKAAKELDFGVSEDLNGEVFSGLSVFQSMQKNGLRCSSSKTYLWPH